MLSLESLFIQAEGTATRDILDWYDLEFLSSTGQQRRDDNGFLIRSAIRLTS